MQIAFVNGKGGVGKSTLCFLAALSLRDAGKRVSVSDLDPQGSITSWIDEERDGVTLSPERVGDFHLLDTRPAIDDESVHQAIAAADCIVMPCTPSPGDITTAKATADVVHRFKKPEASYYGVLNMVKGATNAAKDAPEVFAALGVPLIESSLPDRQCIQRAVLLGWKALDPRTQTNVFKMALEIVS